MAIQTTRDHTQARLAAAKQTLAEIWSMSNLVLARLNELCQLLDSRAQVALHFHPDRITPGAQTVVESLAQTGRYHSQFVTGISNGGLAPHVGGPRDRWEQQLFAGAYRHAAADMRPKYGALALIGHTDGPSPRFGSCYLLLHPSCTRVCTFTYGDSNCTPSTRGVWNLWDDLLAATFTDAFESEMALGLHSVRPPALFDCIYKHITTAKLVPTLSHNLDHYIEAQVHGEVLLARDVQTLVADPAFRTTSTGRDLQQLCSTHGISLRWHPGYTLDPSAVPTDFRGPTMPALAREVAGSARLDAANIGSVAAAVARGQAPTLRRFGSQAEVLQQLKLLWHVLVRWGHPRTE